MLFILIPVLRCQVPGVRYQVSGIRCQVPGNNEPDT
jgi:hypothetical protein